MRYSRSGRAIMLEFKKSVLYDFIYLCKNSIDDINRTASEEDIIKNAMFHIASGVAFTGYIDGKIVCAAGIDLKRDGVGHIWSLFSNEFLKYKITIFRGIKKMLDITIQNLNIHKIQSESRKGFKQSQILLEHLCFKKQRRDLLNKQYYFYIRTC
jgi:hypothetical protein